MDDLTRNEMLVILIEECGEVIQAATKCLRFGYYHDQPGYGVNHHALEREIGDVLGMVDALNLHSDIAQRSRASKMSRAIDAQRTIRLKQKLQTA